MTVKRISAGSAPFARKFVLLGSVFVVAGCGLVYELVAGAISSYLMGDAVTQFSLVIGVFLCAMGVGSYLARFVRTRLVETFIEFEIWIGLLGGGSSIAIFAVSALASPILPVFFYVLCAAIGILVGMEIPLLVRIIQAEEGVSTALSNVLALDYAGALAGSILFPLVVLPYLGLSRSSVVYGIMNLGVAAVGLRLLPGPQKRLRRQVVAAAVILLGMLIASTHLVSMFEDMLYQDRVIYASSSRYQRIVLTRWRDDIRLFLNGNLQFSSVDEARYHESLVIPAMEAARAPRRVLVLGGGDGMAVREVLKYPSVKTVTLVDIDPQVVQLARNRPEFLHLNQGALNDPRVQVHVMDAFKFLETNRDYYDVIICDLPDPNCESLAKLYSTAFYALCARRLSRQGVLVTQATSPFYATSAFWCILKTIKQAVRPLDDIDAGLKPVPYHVNVPSFGEWGFVLAARRRLDPSILVPTVPTRFLTTDVLQAMFVFGKDLLPQKEIVPNRLDDPILFRYYQQGWQHFNQ